MIHEADVFRLRRRPSESLIHPPVPEPVETTHSPLGLVLFFGTIALVAAVALVGVLAR